MDRDRRLQERTRMLRRGQIVFRGGHSVIDCVILDISDGGALLKCPGLFAVPNQFELRIEKGVSYRAEVCRRMAETTGVRFLDAA